MRALSILFMLLFASPVLAAPMVTIAQGSLAGASDNGVDSFKDISYTAPPIGPLRWLAPGPAPHWRGTRDASAFGPACPQHATEGLVVRANLAQSEDCLTLNVWSPQQRSAKLPVMVWIHGGGFTQGAAAVPRFDGAGLARRGVVMVSLNYRLGRLGFFAYPGLAQVNFGLLDQIAALQWVRRNIAAFGGDPDNVTVFGESAGAVAVDALMVSPLAKGLFAKAISESGGTFGTTSMADAQKSAQDFAASIHVLGPDALKALRAVPLEQLLANGEETGPIVDGMVLPEAVDAAVAQGHVAPLPYLAGTNSNEGILLGNGDVSWLDKSLGERRDAVRALYDKDDKLSDDEFHRALFNDEFFAGPTANFAPR